MVMCLSTTQFRLIGNYLFQLSKHILGNYKILGGYIFV